MGRTLPWLFLALLAACGDDGGSGEFDAGGGVDAGPGEDAGLPPADAGGGVDSGVLDRIADIGQPELMRRVGFLASDDLGGREEGSPGGIAAREFLIAELEGCGVAPAVDGSYEQPITTGTGSNILGVIEGTDPSRSARHILLSAHYDHIGSCGGAICNGADDNAAGVSIVVGIACALVASPPARSVLIALWDAEEPPSFLSARMGSEFYAAHPVVPLSDTDVAIALDLVGGDLWPGYQGHFLLGAELAPQVAAAIDGAAVPGGLDAHRGGLHLVEDTPLGHQPWSDYDAFRNASIPVLFLSNGQTKRYHQPEDEADTLDYPKMEREAHYLLRIVRSLGDATEDPVFQAGGADDASDIDTVESVLTSALATGGLVDSHGLGDRTRSRLESDLARVQAARGRLEAGEPLGSMDVQALRNGAQRIMCLAGPLYPETTCNLF